MKNFLIVLFFAAFFAACNNDNRLGGNNNGNAQKAWTRAQKNQWMKDCTQAIASNPDAVNICDCVAGKLEKKYDRYDDAMNAGKAVGEQLTRQCIDGGGEVNDDMNNNNDNYDNNNQQTEGEWTEQDKRKLFNDCMSVIENSGEGQPYCNCIVQKAIRKVRNYAAFNRLTEEDGLALGKACKEELEYGGNDNY